MFFSNADYADERRENQAPYTSLPVSLTTGPGVTKKEAGDGGNDNAGEKEDRSQPR